MRNFAWWLNRKDADDRNIFQGGFLGLDNIGVFDRSAPLPTGGRIDQADGTAWMALYCQNMMQIALELARDNPVYLEQAQACWRTSPGSRPRPTTSGPTASACGTRRTASSTTCCGRPDGSSMPLQGAVDRRADAAGGGDRDRRRRRARSFPGWSRVRSSSWPASGGHGRAAGARAAGAASTGPVLFALFDEARLRRILARMLDEEEFLGPHGIRSVSRWHARAPVRLRASTARSTASATCRRSPTPACSAATPTGAGRCGSRST